MQNMIKNLGNIMGPDVPSASDMWVLTNLFDGWNDLDLYQWVPIENKPLESEDVSYATADGTSIAVKMPWYDSMRELQAEWLSEFIEPNLKNGLSYLVIAKWDDIKKANKYSVRVMSSEVDS